MNKKLKTAIHRYTDFMTLMGIGTNWFGQIRTWAPIGDTFTRSSLYWVGVQAIGSVSFWLFHFSLHWITFWDIYIFLLAKIYIMQFTMWLLGKFMIKIEVPQEQQQYGSKTQYLSPYEKEHRDTLINIAKAVNAKSEFTELLED